MGLFDQVAGMAGEAMAAGPAESGGAGGGALGAVLQMLQTQGGVGAVLDRFHQSGLGGLAASWRGDGPNAPLGAEQLEAALGSGPVAEVAQKLGLDQDAAASRIAQLLPQVMDHLTPGGEPAEGGGLRTLLDGLGRRFGGVAPG